MTLSDRDLLKLAAKAAGIVPAEFQGHDVGWYDASRGVIYQWNPLTDDGDALRLAVELDITVSTPGSHPAGTVRTAGSTTHYEDECPRRAIVRAAASIGRNMP